jgi:hypothetical protein
MNGHVIKMQIFGVNQQLRSLFSYAAMAEMVTCMNTGLDG